MDFEVKGHQPFGPIILEAKCPRLYCRIAE